MAKNEVNGDKSCGSQLFGDGEPSNEWGLEELSTYAQMQYRQIIDGEKLLAPAYWRLGHALVLAKQAFKHGKWVQHLKDLKIDKARASKARAIFRTFDKEEDLAGLTVEEAYARRQRKQPAKPSEDADGASGPKKDIRRLRRAVKSIAERAEEVIHDAAFAESGEAAILMPAIRKTIRQLQELLSYLEQQAATKSPDSETEATESKALVLSSSGSGS